MALTKRTIRVALLLCDTPLPSVIAESGDYLQIYRDWLNRSLATYPDQDVAKNIELIVDGYDVVDKREYPPPGRMSSSASDGYDILMLTGSKHTAHDTSNPFIPPLIDYVRDIATSPQTQHIKLIGVCFGHQIISIAMGGKCERGGNGWEVGVYGNDTTEQGKYWWCGDVKGQGGDDRVYIQQMHRDHVSALPPGFELLLSSPKYPIHSSIQLYPSSTSSQPLAHILTVQGHPEFTPEIVRHVVDAREEQGIFDAEAAKEARRRAGGKDGTGGEGFGRVGWAVWRVMLQGRVGGVDNDGDVNMESNGESSISRHVNAFLTDDSRYEAVDRVLERPGPWTAEEFTGGDAAKKVLRESIKILVIGAGGLGCEILQNLALMGFSDIHVIDMDTIDISNLNRQFLFREADVGSSKAKVAAAFVMNRVPGIKVTPHHNKIQDFGEYFYLQFNIVIAGLDSIAARRWINATLVNMVDEENEESLKPLIDGGTEGFKGQSRVILPTISACYECSIDMITPPTAFPICTIANTPRLPEHCIEWASVLQWPKTKKDLKLDTDDPDHIEWLYREASARAAEFKIEGVTWALTQGVVKNIIPAIASTNAIIAASCCNEAFKIATTAAPYLNNYMMYTGDDSIYTYTFELDKKDDCPVCGGETASLTVDPNITLEDFIEQLKGDRFKLSRPSISGSAGNPIFWHEPPHLYQSTKANLEKTMKELAGSGEGVWSITDPALPSASLSLQIDLSE